MEYFANFGVDLEPSELKGLAFRKEFINGVEVDLYEMGVNNKNLMVILLPSGVSAMFVLGFMKSLSLQYHVVVWECIGCPDIRKNFSLNYLDFKFQLRIFEEVIGGKAFSHVDLVSWCQGTHLALEAVMLGRGKIRSLSMVSPWNIVKGAFTSKFDEMILPIYRGAAKYSKEKSKICFDMISMASKMSKRNDESKKEDFLNFHLKNHEIFHRFCQCVEYSYSKAEGVSQVFEACANQVPIFLIHTKDDEYSHVSQTQVAKERFEDIDVDIVEMGGHFLIFNDPEYVADKVADFIESVNFGS